MDYQGSRVQDDFILQDGTCPETWYAIEIPEGCCALAPQWRGGAGVRLHGRVRCPRRWTTSRRLRGRDLGCQRTGTGQAQSAQ
jgi:hypothetical protein